MAPLSSKSLVTRDISRGKWPVITLSEFTVLIAKDIKKIFNFVQTF